MIRSGGLVRLLRSPRASLSGAALVDLAWRLPGALYDQLALGASRATVSITGGIVVGTAVVGPATTWALMAVGLYHFSPRLYRWAEDLPAERRGFRVLVAVFALSTGVVFAGVDSPRWLLGLSACTVVVSGMALMLYLHGVHGWRFRVPDDRPIGMVDQFFPSSDAAMELEADLTREGVLGVVGTGLALGAFLVLLAFPVYIAGILTAILRWAYPLPDLLVLGWAVVGLVGIRYPVADVASTMDVESRLYDHARQSMRNFKGLALTTYGLLGLLGSVGVFGLAVVFLPEVWSILLSGLRTRPVLVWDLVGIVLLLTGAGLYGTGFWLRELRRLRTFLDDWETGGRTPVDPRPPGLTVPPTLALFGTVLFIVGLDLRWIRDLFAVCWLAFGAVLLVPWWIARKRNPSPTALEDHVVVASLIVQFGGISVLGRLSTLESALQGGPLGNPFPPVVFPVVVLLLFFGYLGDVDRFANEREDLGRYANSVFFCAGGATVLVTGSLLQGTFELPFVIAGTVSIVGGTATVITTYYDL